MPDTLSERLAAWDEKDISFIKRIYADYKKDPEFLSSLIGACSDRPQQVAATWLIKHHLGTNKTCLEKRVSSGLISTLAHLEKWSAQLHVLQFFDRLTLTSDTKEALKDFVDRTGQSDNKLVRAWAFYGFAVIADRFEELKPMAMDRLMEASRVETAGSIKVRVRKGLERLQG